MAGQRESRKEARGAEGMDKEAEGRGDKRTEESKYNE